MVRGLAAYRAILLPHGAWRFSLVGWLARLYRVGSVVGVIVLLTGTGSGFAVAGIASAAIIVGATLGGPLWARWADRSGQPIVAASAAAAALLATGVLTLVVLLGAHPVAVIVAATIVGLATADGGALARARWMHLLPDREARHRALALETALDELAFLIGLPLLTSLAALLPIAGLLAAAALGAAGFAWLAALRATAPETRSRTGRDARPLGWRAWLPVGVAPVVPIFLAVGSLFGFVNLMGVAITAGTVPALSGAVIGALSIGAVAAGLVWGVLGSRLPSRWRLLVAAGLFVLLTPALALSTEPLGFALLAAVAGLGLTPLMISSTAVIEERTASETMTVAMSWPPVAMSAGNAAASALIGLGLDAGGAGALWPVPLSAVALVALGVLAVRLAGARRAPGARATTSRS